MGDHLHLNLSLSPRQDVATPPLSDPAPSSPEPLISTDQDPLYFNCQVPEPDSISGPGLGAVNLRATTTTQCVPTHPLLPPPFTPPTPEPSLLPAPPIHQGQA